MEKKYIKECDACRCTFGFNKKDVIKRKEENKAETDILEGLARHKLEIKNFFLSSRVIETSYDITYDITYSIKEIICPICENINNLDTTELSRKNRKVKKTIKKWSC